jgi:DNA-directed RNA polymerase subunit RPC12/RpoP
LNCTRCGSQNCRRSRRRHIDFALAAIGVWPWRCLDCKARFYARRIPLRYLAYAHCPQCGNTQLLRVRRDRLDSGFLGLLAVWLGAKPLRCDSCRNNFASWRLLQPAD